MEWLGNKIQSCNVSVWKWVLIYKINNYLITSRWSWLHFIEASHYLETDILYI
jgi:hypothetical protein